MTATATQNQDETIIKLVARTLNYSGGHYDSLSLPSKVLTAIAWGAYPITEFSEFVATVREASEDAANAIDEHNINFFVISKGDCYCASGHIALKDGEVDFEEWDADVPRNLQIWKEDDELNEKIQEALSDLALAIANDIDQYLMTVEYFDNGIKEFIAAIEEWAIDTEGTLHKFKDQLANAYIAGIEQDPNDPHSAIARAGDGFPSLPLFLRSEDETEEEMEERGYSHFSGGWWAHAEQIEELFDTEQVVSYIVQQQHELN